jgi:hypothetical protein
MWRGENMNRIRRRGRGDAEFAEKGKPETALNLNSSADHDENSEKTRICRALCFHPMGEFLIFLCALCVSALSASGEVSVVSA